MLESMLKICIYTGINADVTLEDARTECEDRARILKQNSQLKCSLLCKKTKCKQVWLVSTKIKVQTGFIKGFLNLFLGFSDFRQIQTDKILRKVQIFTQPNQFLQSSDGKFFKNFNKQGGKHHGLPL